MSEQPVDAKQTREDEESKSTADVDTDIAKDAKRVLGTMERGTAYTFCAIEQLDKPQVGTSFLYYGCLFIENIVLPDFLRLVEIHPTRLSMVDHMDDRTLCVRLNPLVNVRMAINRGHTPCVFSTAESTMPPAPHAHWYHFQYAVHRQFVCSEVDWLYTMFPRCKIHLVAELHPLSLIYIPGGFPREPPLSADAGTEHAE